jgi:hypothetical protein
VLIDRLAGLLGEFEANVTAGLLLANSRTLNRITMRRDVFHLQAHEIASPELTVDCQIEESQVPLSFGKLQARADCPNVFRLQGRLLTRQLTLVPGSGGQRSGIPDRLHSSSPLC